MEKDEKFRRVGSLDKPPPVLITACAAEAEGI
jgi:hypothetical protein